MLSFPGFGVQPQQSNSKNTLSKVKVSRGTAPLAVPSTFKTANVAINTEKIRRNEAIFPYQEKSGHLPENQVTVTNS